MKRHRHRLLIASLRATGYDDFTPIGGMALCSAPGRSRPKPTVLRDTEEWVFVGLVLMLLPPAALYLIAHLIFPDPIQGAEFKTHYYGAMRPVWWLAVLVTIASTLFKPLAFGADLLDLDNAAAVPMVVGFIALAKSKSVVVHPVLVPAFLVLLLWDVLCWNPTVRLG